MGFEWGAGATPLSAEFWCFKIAGSVGSPTVSSTTISSVELSLFPGDADQTLMRIPESQVRL